MVAQSLQICSLLLTGSARGCGWLLDEDALLYFRQQLPCGHAWQACNGSFRGKSYKLANQRQCVVLALSAVHSHCLVCTSQSVCAHVFEMWVVVGRGVGDSGMARCRVLLVC